MLPRGAGCAGAIGEAGVVLARERPLEWGAMVARQLKGAVHATIPDTAQQTLESIPRLATYPAGRDDPAPVNSEVPWISSK
jgi:hypothetical protein